MSQEDGKNELVAKLPDEEIARKQISFIEDVFKTDCPLFLFGGYADDVLLNNGVVSRTHGDIDFIARESDMEAVKMYFENLGAHTEEFSEENQEAKKLKIKRGDIEAEVNFLKWDDEKICPYMERSVSSGIERGYFDPHALEYPKQKLSGLDVKVISPLMLLQTSLGYEGVSDSKDSTRLQKLEELYGLSEPGIEIITINQ